MLEIFAAAVNAIAPIVLLIVLGYVLKSIRFLNKDFLAMANKLVFRVFLPTLLFYNVYSISNLGDFNWNIVIFCVAVIAVIFVLGLLTVFLFIKDPKQKGVILQSAFRSNFAIIGIPLAQYLGGGEAEAVAAIISAVSIPLFNVLAVISLTVFIEGNEKKVNLKDIIIKIIKNPLIIGVVSGIAALIIRSVIPDAADGVKLFTVKDNIPFIYSTIESVGRIASPLALIVLGGQFEFSAIKGMLGKIVLGTVWRIILAPFIGIGAAVLLSHTTAGPFSFGVNEFPALVALFGTPTAVSSAIMASEMDNDGQLAGQLVVWTSVCSVATMFIIICLLMSMGLLCV